MEVSEGAELDHGHARDSVMKWKTIARTSASFSLLLLTLDISPSTRAWENSLPWCLVSDSGSVNQCFNTKAMCMKEAEKQHKTCVFIPPKK